MARYSRGVDHSSMQQLRSSGTSELPTWSRRSKAGSVTCSQRSRANATTSLPRKTRRSSVPAGGVRCGRLSSCSQFTDASTRGRASPGGRGRRKEFTGRVPVLGARPKKNLAIRGSSVYSGAKRLACCEFEEACILPCGARQYPFCPCAAGLSGTAVHDRRMQSRAPFIALSASGTQDDSQGLRRGSPAFLVRVIRFIRLTYY